MAKGIPLQAPFARPGRAVPFRNSVFPLMRHASFSKPFPQKPNGRAEASAGGGGGAGNGNGGGDERGGGGDGDNNDGDDDESEDAGDGGLGHGAAAMMLASLSKEQDKKEEEGKEKEQEGEKKQEEGKKNGGAKKRKKVLIIMSDTGGGHKASGQAIAASLDELYPNKIDTKIVDLWTDHGKFPFNECVSQYQFAAKHPWVWKLMYEFARFPVTKFLTQRIAAVQSYDDFKKFFKEEDSDMVISVHPCCQHLPVRAVDYLHRGKNRTENMPFVTVVTDLGGCHPLWFHEKVDTLYVPSDVIEEEALRHGVPKHKMRKYGLPIRPGFKVRNAERKASLRKKLGLRGNVRTALIVGGGDGVGKLGSISKEIASELGKDGGGPGQVVVVCGKNEEVKAKLENEVWPKDVHVSVKGFVRNMDQLMGAADCIITKAGPGTIAEACASGIPIMLSGFLPGQEEGNVPFVVDGGFGAYSKEPKEIAKTVSGWLNDPQLLSDMSNRSRSAGRPEAINAIAADIGKQLFHKA